jgi:hypothetical protein
MEQGSPNVGIFPPPPPPLMDAAGNTLWVVDSIRSHRDLGPKRRRDRQYLVHWRGFPASADTWEPRDRLLVDVPGLVAQYELTTPFRTTSSQKHSRR